ncbi:MAG: hypothetical protein CXZ00_09050 [Acidobacteria bacterium]|nr:MAG: hypothetical protein CXZ00_09050 [Acidobacteriota bacterium]
MSDVSHTTNSQFAERIQRYWNEEQWFVAVRLRKDNEYEFDPSRMILLRPPGDRFFADPFVVERENRNYLFVEEFVFSAYKGVISVVEFDEQGFRGSPVVVLEAEHHLSYPFIFEWEGQTYMLPEARDSGNVSLFRAVEFPNRWEFAGNLLENVWAVDSTIFEHEGKFWMFAGGVIRNGRINGELFLYYADSPLGPWHPHPKNPVVADTSRARPAGTIFSQGGSLIRPGQDCSLRYGRAVVLNRIEEITTETYKETSIRVINPDWFPGIIGTHTISHSEHFQTLDALMLTPQPRLIPKKLWWSLRDHLWKT